MLLELVQQFESKLSIVVIFGFMFLVLEMGLILERSVVLFVFVLTLHRINLRNY